MAMHPDIQKKAREELDLVVGPDRLPIYEDYESLPYIQAIFMECARWLPPAPISLPHRVTMDDYYGGYFIPEGTVVMAVRIVLINSNSTNYTLTVDHLSLAIECVVCTIANHRVACPPDFCCCVLGISSATPKNTLIPNDSILIDL